MVTDSNFHTHTIYCDGKSTAEEVVSEAINKNFRAIGFSGHSGPDFCTYKIRDLSGYKAEIKRLKEKYKNDIEIYLGIEEEALSYFNREEFDYILGSSHYVEKNGEYYPVDSSIEKFNRCIEVFGGDYLEFSKAYYERFLSYLKVRKPDIIGHFDLITKFDEKNIYNLNEDKKYRQIALKYFKAAIKLDLIFEMNTGAISRGYRTTPYISTELLYELKKSEGKIMINSDSHQKDTIAHSFDLCESILKEVGFKEVYTINKGEFVKVPLK